jgi:hypothetical protein
MIFFLCLDKDFFQYLGGSVHGIIKCDFMMKLWEKNHGTLILKHKLDGGMLYAQ